MKRRILDYYVDENGKKPFLDWRSKLDVKSRTIVTSYINRVANGGSLKNIKALKDGIFEIKIYHGSGLRVYFANDGEKIILLLMGGNKSSQKSDINKAKEYWRNYAEKK